MIVVNTDRKIILRQTGDLKSKPYCPRLDSHSTTIMLRIKNRTNKMSNF